MILVLVLVGFMVGVASAAVVFIGGAGILGALLAYAAFGSLAVIAVASVVAFGPHLHARPVRHDDADRVAAMLKARHPL